MFWRNFSVQDLWFSRKISNYQEIMHFLFCFRVQWYSYGYVTCCNKIICTGRLFISVTHLLTTPSQDIKLRAPTKVRSRWVHDVIKQGEREKNSIAPVRVKVDLSLVMKKLFYFLSLSLSLSPLFYFALSLSLSLSVCSAIFVGTEY